MFVIVLEAAFSVNFYALMNYTFNVSVYVHACLEI